MLQQLGEDAPDGPVVDSGGVPRASEQQLGGPVPQRDNLGGVRPVVSRLVKPREAKVAELQLAPVVQQQVTELQVPVEHPPAVEVLHRLEQLQAQALALRLGERHSHRLEKPGEVVLAVLEHEEYRVGLLAIHHPQQVDDVLVARGLEDPHLAQRGHGHAVSLLVHAHLLQRNDFAGLFVPRAIHHAVRALADASCAMERGRVRLVLSGPVAMFDEG